MVLKNVRDKNEKQNEITYLYYCIMSKYSLMHLPDGTNTYMYTFPDHFKSSQVKSNFISDIRIHNDS